MTASSAHQTASVDGRDLPLDRCGAAVLLVTPSKLDWEEVLPGGITVGLGVNSRAVLVDGLDGSDVAGDRPLVARTKANEALDLVAARSAGAYALADLSSPFMTWWHEDEGAAMRLGFEVQMTFKMQIGGEPGAYPLDWHPCMRFFRMSQTTDDLFDSFRNVYLAIESILSDIEPMPLKSNGKPDEGEGIWTKRALGVAQQKLVAHNPSMTFGSYLPPGHGADDLTELFEDIYRAQRTSIFHAKSGLPVALPQEDADRALIADALDRYTRLYTDLVEVVDGARFLRSGLSPAGFQGTAQPIDQWQVGVDSEPYASLEDFESRGYDRLVTLQTKRIHQFDTDFRGAVLGSGLVGDLPEGLAVRTIGAKSTAGHPVSYDDLGFTLTLNGVNRLECLVTYEAFSAGHKTRFES